MKKFQAKFNGCLANAIGMTYWIETTVEAESEDAARLKLYDDYDHIMHLTLKENNPQKG